MTQLAIEGGKPVRDTYLPYGQQWINDDDINGVIEVLRSDYLTTGPKIQEFEEKLARYVNAKYAVVVSNGTAALHAAMYATGIGRGDEVITTPLTFAADANCIKYQGGTPIFADVKLDTYNIDPIEIRNNISSKTKAMIPVDYTGQPVQLDEIHEIAEENDLNVIEDGTHAIGAEYKGKKIGGLSDMTVFSFHPVKHIATGEGGAITTNDEELYERLKLFRNHGITRESKYLTSSHGPWYYEQIALGYNYRLTDIQAALGILQLDKIDTFISIRKKYVDTYNKAFKDLDGVKIPHQCESTNSSWHLYVIQLELEKLKLGRKEIFEALHAENIGVNVHYIPVYYFPYYQKLGYKNGLCPNAEYIYERIITLPLFPKMTEKDVDDVIEAVTKVIS